MSNYNVQEGISNILDKITKNIYFFKEDKFSYNTDIQDFLEQKTNEYTIKASHYNKCSKLVFFNKENEELFTIQQNPKGSTPNFRIMNKNSLLQRDVENKLLEEITNITKDFDQFLNQTIETKKIEDKQEHQNKLNTIYNYFNVKELENNQKQILDNSKTYQHGVEYFVQYLFKQSPRHLYHKNEKNELVYSLKTSMGEVEVNFGNTDFHVSEKRLKINFLNDKKETVFSMNGLRDKMFGQDEFDFNFVSKDTILRGEDRTLILASIPTEKLIKEMVDVVNKDINDFTLGVKKENEELLTKVTQLNQPEIKPEVVEDKPIEPVKVEIKPEITEIKDPIIQEKPNKNLILSIREKFFSTGKKTNKNTLN